MTEILARLQEAVGDTYRIEQEMARGGMSRLFLATEASLHRQVVIKLLPPDLANEVSATRFRKEAELAAGLQHPHILPVLGAGAEGDLLYYVMPYVQGESLRHHLERHGAMPVAEAVRLLREVADALAYAHSRGIVHRDIKPENILLEQGHAVLTDFGVARALAESATARLTQTGMSVGTPAYMSPEQLAAEPNIDARADVYALAVVGYEMLTGTMPFRGPTAQAILTAALSDTPKPVATIRSEVPGKLSGAIATGMAKDPNQRFASAGSFRDALGPTEPSAERSKGRLIAIVATVLVVIGAVSLGVRSREGSVSLDPDLLAVAPFGIVGAEDLQLWGEGMIDIVSRHLDGAGALRTLSPTVAVGQWEGRADPSSAQAFGKKTGAGLVVFGSIIGLGPDSARLVATLYDVARAAPIGADIELRESRERADRLPDSLSLRIVDHLSRVRTLGPARLKSLGSRSPAAVKAFLQAEQFIRRISWDSAIAYFQQAVEQDSAFVLAWWRLGDALAWNAENGTPAKLRAAALNRDGLTTRDSLLITFDSIFTVYEQTSPDTLIDLDRRMWETVETAVRRYPEDPLVWYKYGDALLHMGVRGGRWPDSAQVAFERAIALDSTQPDALEHAKLLAFQLDGPERASLFVNAMLALDPTGAKGEALHVEAAVLDSGLTPEGLAERAKGLSRPAVGEILADLARSPFLGAHLVALLRAYTERFPDAGPGAALRLAYRGHLAEASVLAGPQGFAAAEIAVLRASPDSLLAYADRQLARPGSWQDGTMFPLVMRLAEMGELERVRKAIGLAPREFGSSPMGMRMEDEVNAFTTAVARGDTAAAMAGWEDRSPLLRVWWFDLAYARLLTGRGRHHDALEVLEPLGMAVLSAYTTFPSMVMLILERGRIHERVGNREQALRDYGYVRNVWATADSVLQPFVREATDAVSRLTAESQR